MSFAGEVFLKNIDIIFFFYGLAFFSLGLTVLLESHRSYEYEFARALKPLSVFGLVHGSHEWFEMLLIMHPEYASDPRNSWISIVRVVFLAISFIFLVDFGAILLVGESRKRLQNLILGGISLLWLGGLAGVYFLLPDSSNKIVAADVYTRYSMAIPGAVLTAWGLFMQRYKFFQAGLRNFGNDIAIAALAFLAYGVVGQLFASPSAIFPSNYLNSEIFLRYTGFPVQVFRAFMATTAAIFLIRSLRTFEVANLRRLDAIRDEQVKEKQQLEQIQAELLHRTVKAQESERQRIARELHDETGQMLTGLGLGLRGLAETIAVDPQRAMQQAKQLEGLATKGIDDLQHMVGGLHPPQLDELGLMAALRWFVGDITKRSKLDIILDGDGNSGDIPQEVRLVFFRIAQEAITNIIRHAKARCVNIKLVSSDEKVTLHVVDDGIGFYVEEKLKDVAQPPWGLLGMIERATLIQGTCNILSNPQTGTHITVDWPRRSLNG